MKSIGIGNYVVVKKDELMDLLITLEVNLQTCKHECRIANSLRDEDFRKSEINWVAEMCDKSAELIRKFRDSEA